jgi:integrase
MEWSGVFWVHGKIKIRRRGSHKYFAVEIPLRFRRPGERRTEIMATNRAELSSKYEREIESRKRSLDTQAARLPLADFLKSFLDYYKSDGGVEPQTWADYRFHIDAYIVPVLGKIALSKLTTRDIDQWSLALRAKISARTSKPLSERTLSYAAAVLRRALQFAVDWNYIAANPASARIRTAKRRRKITTSKIQYFTPEQSRQFRLAVRGDRFEALYLLALMTGMREGELFGLKWTDLHLDASLLTVNHSLAHTKRKKGEEGERVVLKGPKTVGSRRTIELPSITVSVLREHQGRQQDQRIAAREDWREEGYVFTSRFGTPLDWGNTLHRFQALCKKNDLPKIRFYDLRHTHASLLIAEGVHPKKIAERLGHSSIKLTMDTYGHLFEGSDRESAEQMDRLFGSTSMATPARNEATQTGSQNNVIVMPKRPRPRIHADKNADNN